ncbi:MAG: hypothetical protein LLG42_16465 [Chloroflexi bacterium]|nr:hypothetical protein [Chloroflexota bacterium]
MKHEDDNNSLNGNQRAFKHGGEGAVRRISEGKPLIGLAAEEEKIVTAELAETGPLEIVKRDAIRLQSALNLYWNAVEKAAQDGDIAALDRYVARFGWLSGVTLRAWADVSKNEKGRRQKNIIDILKGGEE